MLKRLKNILKKKKNYLTAFASKTHTDTFLVLTALYDSPKNGMVSVQGAAVPAVMTELMLALSNPLFSPAPNRLHDVWILLTQLPLFIHQPGNVVTDHTGTKGSNVPETQTQTQTLKT